MNQKLYLECYAGISGDMMVAALLDLGADESKLRKTLESLSLDGYSIEVRRVKKAGLNVCDFNVLLDAEHDNHDHDMEYLHALAGDAHAQRLPHEHQHDHGHGHEHTHRGLPEIISIIENSAMTERAKAIAMRIFRILAEAEAKAHGVAISDVHFHEVGAVDSIVDVAAVAICLDDLGIEDVIVPVLYEGIGSIRCQHGVIPVPVPATLNIVSACHLRLRQMDVSGEFVTPTGAAIVAAVCTGQELPNSYTVEKIGLGAGKRTYEKPSILRAMLITPENAVPCNAVFKEQTANAFETNGKTDSEIQESRAEESIADDGGDCIVKLECNLDDCTGETLGYTMERLFAAGARDVFYTPVFMKKNRPAYLLTTICTPEMVHIMEEILFVETSTIGIRRERMMRSILPRETSTMQTKEGVVQVKTVWNGNVRHIRPEYESVAVLARERKVSFWDLYQQIEVEINGRDPEK